VNTLDVAAELAKHFDAAMLSRGRPRFDLDEIPLVAPDSIEGFVEAIRFAAREKLCIVPTGLGSKLGWCAPPTRADFMLSTRRFTGVVSHVPDDGTIAVRAGTTMADLARTVESGGHRLTPDVPRPERCTIGGVVAAGESGADRLRFGPVRHHVLGLKVLFADGTIAKCGGQLVKNVTGFDLMKLYTGSHGTLCVILEVALRLFPAPEHETLITNHVDCSKGLNTLEFDRFALETARRALALSTRTVSLSMGCDRFAGPVDGWHLAARLFGKRNAVADEREQILRVWPDAIVLDGIDARTSSELHRDQALAEQPTRSSYRVTCLPARLSELLDLLLYYADLACLEGPIVIQPGVAELNHVASIQWAKGLDGWVACANEMRVRAVANGGTFALRDAPSALASFDPVLNDDVGLDLMRDLKRALDPNGVFASGRFVGGI
jgi:glycolate oxidase FAD binding subunit